MIPLIREAVRPFCALDAFAGPEGCYTIDSLYFDTPDMKLYHATVYEVVDRFKLRARTYPGSPGSPVFLECKRRYNDVISKTRGKVKGDWAALIDDSTGKSVAALSDSAVERFVALYHTHHFQPCVVVRYEREAWVSTVDEYARVTFDQHVRCQRMDTLSLDCEDDRWRAADDGVLMKTPTSLTVLELKFTSHVPSWLISLVKRFDLTRRSFSKYGCSVQASLKGPSVRRNRFF